MSARIRYVTEIVEDPLDPDLLLYEEQHGDDLGPVDGDPDAGTDFALRRVRDDDGTERVVSIWELM